MKLPLPLENMHIFQGMGLLCGFNLPKATGGLQDACSVDTIVLSMKGNTDCEETYG